MTFNYDYYSRFENPSLLLCHPDDTPIGMLTDIEDYKLELKFNEVSKLSFTIYQIINIDYKPVPDGEITATTQGKYFIYKENRDYENLQNGFYEEILLDGKTNDLTLQYYEEDVYYNSAFEDIMERREILVEDIGYFIITDVQDESGDKGRFKSVSASSCEYELNYIEMPYLEGTYVLYSADNWQDGKLEANDFNYYIDYYVTPMTIGTRYVREDNEFKPVLLPEEFNPQVTYYGIDSYVGKDCLLYEIMRVIPHWKLKQSINYGIASTDPDYVELAQKYRTFEGGDDSTVYAFLKQKLQESYECFVKFDILNREIEICKYDDALINTNFIINSANFSDEIKVKTTIDDYTNALSVTASDSDVYMSSVNPLGTSTIYNFKHDLESGFIKSEYQEAEVGSIKKWYFYVDEGQYVPVYINNTSPEYDSSKQYYLPTEAGTLAAVLTIWQQKYDDASIEYNGINYDNWDDWCEEIDRIKNWVTGDYYYVSGKSGTGVTDAFLVVTDPTKIAGCIQTRKDLKIKWKASYNLQYTLDPAPTSSTDNGLPSQSKPESIEAVKINDVEKVYGVDYWYMYNSATSTGEIEFIVGHAPEVDDTVEFIYQYVPSVSQKAIKYCYNFYKCSDIVDQASFSRYTSPIYIKGKYGFEVVSEFAGRNVEYFSAPDANGSLQNVDATTYLGTPVIGRYVAKNDYIPIEPSDNDQIDTYYSWNGAKFVEVATQTNPDGTKQGMPYTRYFNKRPDTESGVSAKIADIMAWINSHRGDLDNGMNPDPTSPDFYKGYKRDENLGERSYNVVGTRAAYGTIDQQDTYGKIYYVSQSNHDFGNYMSDELSDYLRTHHPSQGDVSSSIYAYYDFKGATYTTQDGVPGVVQARLVQTKVDLELEDVISEVVGIVTTISGYTAQIKALLNVTSDQPELVENEINQIYGFVADARANLIVALDKYRMLTADREQLSEQIGNMATNLSFETFFYNYFVDNGMTAEAAGDAANALYSKFIRYIRQQSYNEENITIEDNMTSEEKQNQELELYKYAVDLLKKLIMPTYTVDIDIESFPFLEEYIAIANGINVGSVINIELQNGEVEAFNLIGVTMDLDSKSISLKFGNRISDSDAASVFEDLQTSVATASAIVASNYIDWGAAADETTQLLKERNHILDATLRGITARNSSMRDNVVIDSSGIKCMTQKIDTDGAYVDDYGLWISNGVIMFTDNGWKSSKMAVGRMVDANGNTIYGFNGDTILANTIAADKLVAGTLSSGSNLIKDGSFESFMNDALSDTQYTFQQGDAWEVNADTKEGVAPYVKTVASESDACLGDRYLYMRQDNTIGDNKISIVNHAAQIVIPEDNVYTISFYCKPAGSVWKNTALSYSGLYDSRPWLEGDARVCVAVYRSVTGGLETLVANAFGINPSTPIAEDELDQSHWKRFSATGELKAGTYTVEISGTAEVDYMVDGVMLEQSAMINDFSNAPGENYAKYTVMYENGLRIYGGKLKIFNNIGTEVMYADNNGNLSMTGVITAKSGSNIAGWITRDTGFYKEQLFDEAHPDYGKYPFSGLFVKDAHYSIDPQTNRFVFDDSGNKTLPLLFTGYTGSGEIGNDNCNFYVDNNGYLKTVNATITGTRGGIKTLTNGSYNQDNNKTTYSAGKGLSNFIVAVDELIIPQGAKFSNGYTYNSTSGNLAINGDMRTKTVKIYSGGFGASISCATISQVDITNANISRVVMSNASINVSDIINASINTSTITDCTIKNNLWIYRDNTKVAFIKAAATNGTATASDSATNLLIDVSQSNGNGSITIKAKNSNKYTPTETTSRSLSVCQTLKEEKNATDVGSLISDAITSAFETIKVNGNSLTGSIHKLQPYNAPNNKTSQRKQAIFLDGDVYITGLQAMYGSDYDIVSVISDINSKINTIQHELSLLSIFSVGVIAGLVSAVGAIAMYLTTKAGIGSFFGSAAGFAVGGPIGALLGAIAGAFLA